MEVNIYENFNLFLRKSTKKFLKISNERIHFDRRISGIGLKVN